MAPGTQPSELKGANYHLHRFKCTRLEAAEDSNVHMWKDSPNKKVSPVNSLSHVDGGKGCSKIFQPAENP